MPSKKNKKKTTQRKKVVCCSACEVGRKCSAKTAKKKTARKTRTSGKSRSSGTRHPPGIVYNVHSGFGDRGAANAPSSNILNAPPVDYRAPPAAAAFPGAANPVGGGPPPPFGGGGGGPGQGLFPGGGGAGAPAAGPAPFGPPANLHHVNDFVQMLQLQPHLMQAPGVVRQNQQVAIRNAAIPGSEPSDGSPIHANIRTPSLVTTPPNVLVQTVNEVQAERRSSPSTGGRTTVPESRMPFETMDFASPNQSRSQISSILPPSRPSVQPKLDFTPIPLGTDPNISSLSSKSSSRSFQQPGDKVRPTNLSNDFSSASRSGKVHHGKPQRITQSGESRERYLSDFMDPDKPVPDPVPIIYSSNKSTSMSKDSLDDDSYLRNYSKTSTPPGSLPKIPNFTIDEGVRSAKKTARQVQFEREQAENRRQHYNEISTLLDNDSRERKRRELSQIIPQNESTYSGYFRNIAGWKPTGPNVKYGDKSQEFYDSIIQ